VEKWKSKSRIPTFPLPRQPAAQGETRSTHRYRGAAAQDINSGSFLFRAWLAAHDGPFGCHPDRILDRRRALMEASISQPDMQFAVELMAHLHFLPRIALLAACVRKLDDTRPEADRVVMPYRALVSQAEESISIHSLVQRSEIIAHLARRFGKFPVVLRKEPGQHQVGLIHGLHFCQP